MLSLLRRVEWRKWIEDFWRVNAYVRCSILFLGRNGTVHGMELVMSG